MHLITKPHSPKALILGAPNLIKSNQVPSLVRHYTLPLDDEFKRNITFASIQVDQNSKYLKKAFIEDAKGILEYCEVNGIDTIGCTNPKFWQFATKDKQFTANIGKSLKGVGDFEGFKIVPILNHFVLLAKPQAQGDLSKGVTTLNLVLKGEYDFNTENLADKVVKHLVTNLVEAKRVLNKLSESPIVTMDIETTGLTMGKDKIITIAFADSTKEGWAFPLCEEYSEEYKEITKLISSFLKGYRGKHIWHNGLFDLGFVMRDIMKIPFTNQKLINKTINNMDIEDTMHIAYLCRNSCTRTGNGLKELIFDKYGEYDEGVDQSRLLDYSFEEVGTYNILDVTATMEVYNEYYLKMVEEAQEAIFKDYYKVSIKTLMKLKYRGVEVDKGGTTKATEELAALLAKEYDYLSSNEHVVDTEYNLCINAMYKYNTSHKKQKVAGDFDIKFNPNSSTQKAILLFDVMGLPVLETTKTGNQATGKDVIKQLIHTVKDEDAKLLETLLSISEAAKVSTAFLSNFKELAIHAEDGSWRLHGNFNLSGSISGRISSNSPNLMNMPSGSTYGKMIKSLFKAPEGMVFWYADHNALESRISAIVAKDSTMIDMITENKDSHSVYTAAYFQDELKERGLPYGLNITAEESYVIKEQAGDLRQKSKAVTFALTYNGTEHTVSKSLGITKEAALIIVERYHSLHKDLADYYKRKTDFAEEHGYYEIETGLKLRAPGLQSIDEQVVAQTKRSAENALLQGFGMMTIRGMNTFQARVEKAGLDNEVIMNLTIHDSVSGGCINDIETIKWVNDNFIECMTADFVKNPSIPLAAELDIGFSWDCLTQIPNNASVEEISKVLEECKEELDEVV